MEPYDISVQALEDLSNIWEYTVENWSEKQADRYYSKLIASFNDIVKAPFTTGQSYDFILNGLRGIYVESHVVFFMIQENSRVLIVRILHKSMDYVRHFNH